MDIVDVEFVSEYIRLTEDAYKKGWHERNGGNLSYRIKSEEVALIRAKLKPAVEFIPIGISVPNLAGEYFLVTGSGKYMRNVALSPEDNLAIVQIDEIGENYSIVWGLEQGGQPTSELHTHMMNHSIKKELSDGEYRVIYHGHPPNAIALTFVLPLEDRVFTRTLWEMMTECPVIFPKGVGVVPWMVPGGKEIAAATGKLMKKYDVAIWAHHGVFCAGPDFESTFGLMETIEKAAEIYVKVQTLGGVKQTIPVQGFRDLARDFNIDLDEKFLD
jgi:rhamnulose-1-phosphate aldolase